MPDSTEFTPTTEPQSSFGIPEGENIPRGDRSSGSVDNIVIAAKGSGIITVGKLFEYVGRFVIAFLLARMLGAEQFGLYSLALSTATILSTISLLGMDDAVLRFLAIYASQEDEESMWGMLQLTFGFTIITSILLSAGLYFFAEPIAVTFFSEPMLATMLRLVAVIVPFLALSNMLLFATRGFKRMDYGVISKNFIQITVRIILLSILLLINLNAFTAMVTFGLADVTSSIVLTYFLNKEFPLRRAIKNAKRDARALLSFSFPFWFSDIINTVRNNIQVMLLGSLSTITSAGIFTIVDKVNLISIITYHSVQTSIRPIIAELQSKDEWQEVGRLYHTSTRWGLLVNIPMTLIMVLFSREILLLFGESFVDGGTALIILALSEFIKVFTGMSGTIIDMSGLNRLKMVNTIIQVVMAVGINIYLIPRWGLLGAAIAVFITEATINILRMVQVYVIYQLLPYNRLLIKLFAAGFAASLTSLIVNQIITIDQNLLSLIIGIILVISVYCVVLYFLGLPDDDVLVIKKYVGTARNSVSGVISYVKRINNQNLR